MSLIGMKCGGDCGLIIVRAREHGSTAETGINAQAGQGRKKNRSGRTQSRWHRLGGILEREWKTGGQTLSQWWRPQRS